MHSAAGQMALGGMLAALAVVIMTLGALIPLATYCCPLLAMLLLIFVLERCGRRIAWVWYAAVSILSCMLCPDPEAAAVFVALGYYPIVRRDLNRIPWRPVRLGIKLVLFNGAVLAMYAVLIWLLQLEAVARSILEEAPWINVLTLLLANVTFLITDALLERFSRLSHSRRKR